MKTSMVILGIVSAIAFTACSKTDPSAGAASTGGGGGSSAAPAAPAAQTVVKITVDGKGYTPSSVQAKKGVPLTLEFTRTTDQTCGEKVVFPELNISRDLPLNQPVAIVIPADSARPLTFQCGMAMYKGSVVAN